MNAPNMPGSWQQFGYAATTLCGRVFVAVLFAYLFALVISLYEAHAFQDLVKSFAGNDKARVRTVLNAVRDAREAEEQKSVESRNLLPYAEIAVRVDVARRALKELQEFDANRDTTHMAFRDGTAEPERRFARIVDELENAVRDLDASPDLSETMKEVGRRISALDEHSRLDQLLVGVEADVAQVLQRYEDFSAAVEGGDSNPELQRTTFEELQKAIDQLQTRAGPQTIEQAELQAIQERWDETSNALREIQNSIDEIPSSVSLDDDLRENQEILQSIASPIAKMELAAFELKALEVKSNGVGSSGGTLSEDEASGFAADVAHYDQAKATLSSAIRELDDVLSGLEPSARIAQALGGDARYAQANTIWRSFLALSLFGGIISVHGLLPSPQALATFSSESLNLILVFTMGAIGSLIYITKDQLQRTIQGQRLTDPPERPLSWFLFRPVFGVVVAFSIYLLYKAGQIALGAGGGGGLAANVNIPILSIISLFAGLLSWQALDTVEAKGQVWLRAQQRRELWATGLGHAIRAAGKGVPELADEVGRSREQLERWINCVDKVTPEMQDRIASKLGKPLQELFSDTRAPDAVLHKALWGVGLRDALKREGAPDAKGLADVLEQPYALVQKWVTLEERVPPAMQAQVAERLGVQPSELFSEKADQSLWWGVGLRTALRETETRALVMAQDMGVGVEEVRRWTDLLSPVSGEQRREIAKYLNRKPNLLFIPSQPSTRRYAVGLREAMRNSAEFGTPGALADALDTEQSFVNDWLDLRQPIYPGAVLAVAELLGKEETDLFSTEPPKPEDFWLARPELGEAVEDRFNGDLDAFARAVVTDSEHAQAWLRGRIALAGPTREVIVSVLNDRNPTGARLLPSALFRSNEAVEQENVPPSGAAHAASTG